MRKIGIFLGNFDPPTICHQNIIRNVVNYDLLDEIFIVISDKLVNILIHLLKLILYF